MKKLLAITFAFIAVTVGWFLIRRNLNRNKAPVSTAYNGPLFSVQFLPNTDIKQETTHDKGTVTHFYDSCISGRGCEIVSFTEYSLAITQSKADAGVSEAFSAEFKPGYWSSPITDITLGGLPAKEQIFRGLLADSGRRATVRVRMTLSQDGLRSWILETSSEDELEGISEADCEKFFNSLKIK